MMTKSKKFLMLLLTLLVSVVVNAQTKINGLYYNLNSETKEAEVTSEVYDNEYYTGDVVIPSTVTYDGVEYNVTTIGEEAFMFSRPTTVTIPESVRFIRSMAFDVNYSLTIYNLSKTPQKIEFNSFTKSCKICVPSGCKEAYEAAQYWSNLKIIDGYVKSVAIKSEECDSVIYYEINTDTKVAEVISGDTEYSGVIAIPSTVTYEGVEYNVTSIADKAFNECKNLLYVGIPNTVTTIGERAFNDCECLQYLTIPASVKNIGKEAFRYCHFTILCNLAPTPQQLDGEVSARCLYVLPGCREAYDADKVWGRCNEIKDCEVWPVAIYSKNSATPKSYNVNVVSGEAEVTHLDYDLSDLLYFAKFYVTGGDVVIPSTVTYGGKEYKVTGIRENVFSGLVDLTSVTIPNSVTNISAGAFAGCSALASVTLPNSLTSIEYSVFSGCSALTSIAIPDKVTKIGYRAFYECKSLNSVTIPNSVMCIEDEAFKSCEALTSVNIPNSVKNIWRGAFCETNISSVTIPASVTEIGLYAFGWCPNLASIKVDANNTVYDSRNNCNAIIETAKNKLIAGCANTIIPNSVDTIGNRAFGGIVGLTSIEIPNSVKRIEIGAFMGTGLTSVVIPESVDTIVNGVFSNCTALASVTIPESVKAIENGAFNACSSLTSVVIPKSVTAISPGLFSGCTALASVTLPNTLTAIGYNAFERCSALASITIPEHVTIIGQDAFCACSSLTSVEIPNSVTRIESGTFGGCSNLASITIPNSVTSIGSEAFYGTKWEENQPDGLIYAGLVLYKYKGTMPANTNVEIKEGTKGIAEDAFLRCSGLTSITIPNSVMSIGKYAFYGCSGLTSITIPNSVMSIGEHAFYGCSGLTSITIPNSVMSIGEYAFSNCSSLTSVEIPNSVTIIEKSTFAYCYNLASVAIPNSVTSIAERAFSDTNLTSVVIPESVTSIGYYAFNQNKINPDKVLAASVTNLAREPQKIATSDDVFYIEDILRYGTLHVLPGCKAAYEAADVWKYFTIVEDADLPVEITNVSSLIGNIGNVEFTEACKAKIDAARSAYDALTKEQQALVKNFSMLVDAENAYKQLEATGIADVEMNDGKKDGKYLVNGKIVIVRNGKNYNLNGQAE